MLRGGGGGDGAVRIRRFLGSRQMETIDAATETPPPGENGFYQTRPPKTEVFERKKKRRFGKWKKIKRSKNNVFFWDDFKQRKENIISGTKQLCFTVFPVVLESCWFLALSPKF
jgi:hypothetical protein